MRYTIKYKFDQCLITNEDGLLIELSELLTVIEDLNQVAEDIRINGSQLAVRELTVDTFIRKHCASDSWVFSPTMAQRTKANECVYFVLDPLYPDWIKIGRTAHLNQRLRGIRGERGRPESPLQIVAVIKTTESPTIEAALHHLFAPHRIKGEWFVADPILNFINEFRPKNQP
jgi:hypothetical protein